MKNLKAAAIPAVVGQIAAFLFLLLGSLAVKGTEEPEKFVAFFSFGAAIVSGAVCGVFCGRIKNGNGTAISVLSAVLLILFDVLLSFVPGGEKSGGKALLLPVLIFLSVLISAFLSQRAFGKGIRGKRRRMTKKRGR